MPNTPFGDLTVNLDSLNRGVIVGADLDLYGMQGAISNVLIEYSGKVGLDEATVKLGSNVTMTFGYFMLSRVHGAYDLQNQELALGGALTLSGDTAGLIIRVDGEAVISLKDPGRLVTRGDLYFLTLSAGYGETTVDLKNGRMETDIKIGNGNTKIEGHAVVQAPVNGVPWKIEVDKAKVEILDCNISESTLLIDDNGMSMASTTQLLGASVKATFNSDKGLKHAAASLEHRLGISADFGQLGELNLSAILNLTVNNGGVEGVLSADTPLGDMKIKVSANCLKDISMESLRRAVQAEVNKLIKNPLQELLEGVEQAGERTGAWRKPY
jgi:hypothetical protein